MYEKYLEQPEKAGKIRNLKERSINCYKNYVSYLLKYQGKCSEELTSQEGSLGSMPNSLCIATGMLIDPFFQRAEMIMCEYGRNIF